MSRCSRGHRKSGVVFKTSLDAWRLTKAVSVPTYTSAQRRKEGSEASVKALCDPFQTDCNTAFPVLLHSTNVQVLLSKEAKRRPNRTSYVCGGNRSLERIQPLDVDTGLDLGIRNMLTQTFKWNNWVGIFFLELQKKDSENIYWKFTHDSCKRII